MAPDRSHGTGRIPGPLIKAREGDTVKGPLQEPGLACVLRRALDALPRLRLLPPAPTAPSCLASPAATRCVKVGQSVVPYTSALPTAGRRACGPTTTTRRRWRSRSPAGCTARSRSLGRHERRADREFVVVFAPFGTPFRRLTLEGLCREYPRVSRPRRRKLQRKGWQKSPTPPPPPPPTSGAIPQRRAQGHPRRSAQRSRSAWRWREDAPGHLALPLPRRGAHGAGHDRALPGAADDPRRCSSPPSRTTAAHVPRRPAAAAGRPDDLHAGAGYFTPARLAARRRRRRRSSATPTS